MKDKILIHENDLRVQGTFRLIVIDPKTRKVVKIIEGKNSIVAGGRRLAGGMLMGEAGHGVGLTVFALGTGTAVSVVDRLAIEATRKLITDRVPDITRPDTFIFSTFFTAAESQYHIQEAGIFGHASATMVANSGTLFSRWLIAFDNRAGLFDLSFDYRLSITSS